MQPVFMRMWVQSLAWLCGLRIWHCCELWYRSQMWLRSCIAVAVVYRPAAAAQIQPLAWELHMPQMEVFFALRSKKKKKEKKIVGVLLWISRLRIWCCHCCGSGGWCGAGSVPSPKTSACCGCSHKKGKVDTMHIAYHLYLGLGQHFNAKHVNILQQNIHNFPQRG